jgi:hypothetical protein
MALLAPRSERLARIVLHIGVEKTGTTTIQDFSARNADQLWKRGVLYPSGFGPNNHVALVAATGSYDSIRHLGPTEAWREPGDQVRFRSDVDRRLRAVVRRAGRRTMLLSSEHMSSRLGEPQIAALRDMLAPLTEAIDVVVYLRRQDDVLLSLLSSHIKSGGTSGIDRLSGISWLDYDERLAKWERVFGPRHLAVRRYPPENGSLIEDFLAAARLPAIGGGSSPVGLNRSLDARNLQLLRAINERIGAWDSNGFTPQRAELKKFLEARSTGAPPAMSRAQRQRILARFAAGNENVRARHFPESERLFDKTLPEDVPEVDVGFDDAIDLVVDLLRARPQPAPAATGYLRRSGRQLLGGLRRRLLQSRPS